MPAPADAGGDASLVLHAPEDLGVEARAVWDGVVPWLLEQGVLAPSDVFLMVELCEAAGWARRYRQALERLVAKRSPAIIEQLAGSEDAVEDALADPEIVEALVLGSPAAKRLRTSYLESLGRAESIASKFGLTPTDRVRLGLMKRAGAASLVEAIGRAMAAGEAAGP